MRIEYHRTLIADRLRNEAFYGALQSVIEPGKTTVADIGAGTGLLGAMAAKLGAREVYLYETAAVAGVANEILKRNKLRNCHLFPYHSTEMDEPPRADVIVSETLGNYAFEENIIATVADARKRHLKKGGVIIPRLVTQWVCPVISDRIHDELTAWDGVGHGLDFSFARTMSLNNIYVRTLVANELLDGGRAALAWDSVDLTVDARSSRKGSGRWHASAAQKVYGFALWWDAELVAGISLSTSPLLPKTHWEQLYLPLLTPLDVKRGETVNLSVSSTSSEDQGTNIAWSVQRLDRTGKTLEKQAMDLNKGYLP